MKYFNLISAVLLGIVLLMSCDLDRSDLSQQTSYKTGISFTVYSLSSEFFALLNPGNSSAPNQNMSPSLNVSSTNQGKLVSALIIANRIDFILKDSGGTIVDSWSVATTDGMPVDSYRAVPAGTAYTLEAAVYNNTVSTTVPVVSGVSASFDVISGSNTAVSIVCLPVNPQTANPDTVYSVTTVPSDMRLDFPTYSSQLISTGGEQWYTITATSTTTKILVVPDSNSYASAILFDSQGTSLGIAATSYGFLTGQPGTEGSVTFLTTPGSTYYVGVAAITTTGATSATVNFSYKSGPVDNDEENDDSTTAITLPESVSQTGLCLDSDFYKISVSGTNAVQLDLTVANPSLSSMYVFLYDSSVLQNMIGNTILSAGEVGLSRIFVLPGNGDYYIDLSPFMSQGAEYSISWHSVTVVDDSYEDNDTLSTATDLAKDTVLNGVNADQDWYKIVIPQDATVMVDCSMAQSNSGIRLELYDSTGIFLLARTYQNTDKLRILRPLVAGTYYMKVDSDFGAQGTLYQLQWITGL